MKRYILVMDTQQSEMENKVNQLIEQGYVPHGSIYGDEDTWCQPMMLKD